MSKISRFFISFLMICFVCVTVSQVRAAAPTWDGSIDTTFAGGDGTEANPFQIATPAQLAYLAKLTSGTKDYSKDKYFILTDDIYLNNSVVGSDGKSLNSGSFKSWTPIGKNTDGYYFYGHFDGQGHTVSGMYISNSSDYQGLFGCVSGTVKNIIFKDGYLHSGEISGMITGWNGTGALIDNCSTEGFVSITSSYEKIGGITGENSGTIQHCENYAYIKGQYKCYGGITGNLATNAAILYCDNNGEVYCTNGYYDIGGICGSSIKATIKHCTNTGYIHNEGRNVGGILGWDENSTIISCCLNTGDIQGSYRMGGIIGRSATGTILHDCINEGKILGTNNSPYEYGGIAGCLSDSATIYNVQNFGELNSTNGYKMGGIVGDANNSTIYNAWNSDNITGYYNVGGIVGTATNSTIANILNSGNVTATYNNNNDSYKCGGIVANMSGAITNCVNVTDINSSLSYTKAIGYASGNYNYSLKTSGINFSLSLVSSGENNTAFGMKQKLKTPVTVGANTYRELLAALNAVVAEDTTGKYCQWAVEYGINDEYPYPVFARCAAPTIAVDGDGNFTITADSSATIHYTTDGTVPTEDSPVYTGSNKLAGACNLQAIAASPTKLTSAVASYNYGMTVVATPVITISGNTATITCSEAGASIYYSIDGFDPKLSKTAYTAPLEFSVNTTIKAYATSDGKYPSATATAQYKLTQPIWDGTVDSTYSSGSGTEEDPYIIMTPGQLAWLSYNVNTFENYSKDVYYKLGDDIYLNEQIKYGDDYEICGQNTWSPIGYKNSDTHVLDFQGHFDGNGHTIHGLFYNNTSDESWHIGLFGRSCNADIHDLSIEDIYLRGYQRCAGIVGYAHLSTLTNCSNNGGFIYSYERDAGGIVGGAYSSHFNNCRNLSTVKGANCHVAGIAGTIDTNASIDNCRNYGDIWSSYYDIGGIAGYAGSAQVSNCENHGAVTGKSTYSYANCGGIIGSADGTDITSCTNYGLIQNIENSIGGIAGASNSLI